MSGDRIDGRNMEIEVNESFRRFEFSNGGINGRQFTANPGSGPLATLN